MRVLRRNLVAHLERAARRERHHVVGKVLQVVGFLGVAERAQPRNHDLLRIGLARIDHVEDFVRVAESGRVRIVAFAGGDPGLVAVGMLVETVIVKIALEQAEFPEMMRDVFADVGDRAVRAHDNFGFGFFRRFFGRIAGGRFRAFRGLLRTSLLVGRQLHHPAAGIFPGRRYWIAPRCFQNLERGIPEFQVQDFALAREQIVVDAEPVERAQVAVYDGGGDDFGHLCRVAVAFFDVLQRLGAQFEARFVFGQKLRHARIEIPAEIIEFRGLGRAL